MSATATAPKTAPPVHNVIGGKHVECASKRRLTVTSPATGEAIGDLPLSTTSDLDAAVNAAVKAQLEWGRKPVKDRVQVLFKLKALFEAEVDRLAEIVHLENGKTIEEAKGSILRGVECIEFACSLPQIIPGQVLEVGRGVECKLTRFPLGVVAGITPFNFPMMVPLWMAPLAIATGNAFILKPSEQTPLSSVELASLWERAGLPPGIFSVVHGDREIVEGICDHPDIKAVAFVGSTKVAQLVYARGTAKGKRVRAMGGAKNHLVVVPDADPEMTASNVVASATGCAGQRCMAASVLLAVGEVDHILDKIREKMSTMVAGKDIGAVISEQARDRISGFIERAPASGATVALDGRKAVAPDAPAEGYYIGPSIIDNASPDHECACDEIFGPTLTIIRCKNLDEAIAFENQNQYGNAAAIYTTSGYVAQYFSDRASAGMIGVNIGVPVPREPFPFGGWNSSAFGDGDITGIGAIDFWTRSKKITTKWSDEHRAAGNWMS
ncbi:MAG TPA: CoA-acylating methylmalonate-semialdehyde dehydrogenase [Longimicrobiales bacterium]|nr:CoA-acylating methylmalonate-semialdehyde dehydrogenase [Longimicrobiales bacterium]